MAVWPALTRDSALRLLTEVGFEERLIGYESSGAMGNLPLSLYSLREVHDFLLRNGGERINYLDLDELGGWVGRVLGDRLLRQAIGETLQAGGAYFARAARVAQVLRERLDQAQTVVSA